jgi:uncharacterized Zn-finger protein
MNQCPNCRKKFSSKSNLTRHLKKCQKRPACTTCQQLKEEKIELLEQIQILQSGLLELAASISQGS